MPRPMLLHEGDERELRLLRNVIDATRLLITVVERDGRVRAVNPAVRLATGVPDDVCGRPIWEMAALEQERALLAATFTADEPRALPSHLLFHLVNRAGHPRMVDWNVRAVDLDDKQSAV